MNETIRTAIFVAVAVVIALVTWASWKATAVPEFAEPERVAMEGKPLFPKFTDPWAATSLEIVKYDEETASPVPFQVAQIEGEWSIPSHYNYPTDAKDQLAEAASSVIGLEVVDMASDDPDTHEMYGVVDPDSKPASTAPEDVGTRVAMRDKDDKALLDLIIGKQVPDRDELRYVRKVGENPVYTVAVKTDKLSNKFEDWIEEDLLKLNAWDIREVDIQDYSVIAREGRGELSLKADMTLKYDDTGDPKWSLVNDLVFSPEQKTLVPGKMAEDEELDTKKLDDMKYNLDDLNIVDVRRKPPGLSADLRAAGTLMNDLQTLLSLQSKGFYLVESAVEGKVYLNVLSNQGELGVAMKDGVQYVLRFGEFAGRTAESSEESEEPKADEEAPEESEDSETAGQNRYLFVMAQFNPRMIPEPELEALPEAKPPAPAEKAESDAAEGGEPQAEPAQDDGNGEAETVQAEPNEEKAEPDEEKAGPDEEEADAADDKDELQRERERIEKENQRKRDEYEEKIKKGQERVQELNDRFADWYYIIADDVYQKIRLGRDDLIKKKEKDEDKDEADEDQAGEKEGADEDPADAQTEVEGNAISDFEKLKQEGPEGGEE